MVAKLEQRMQRAARRLKGWLLLGRSYLALERFDDAEHAYDQAHRLDANNVEAMLGLGEAMSLRAGGNITPAAAELFEQALTLGAATIRRRCCTAASPPQCEAIGPAPAAVGKHSRTCIRRRKSRRCWMRESPSSDRRTLAPAPAVRDERRRSAPAAPTVARG